MKIQKHINFFERQFLKYSKHRLKSKQESKNLFKKKNDLKSEYLSEEDQNFKSLWFCGVNLAIFLLISIFGLLVYLILSRENCSLTGNLSLDIVIPPNKPIPHYNLNKEKKFKVPKIIDYLQCSRIWDNDTNYINLLTHNRLVYRDFMNWNNLPTNCSDIFSRNYFATKPNSDFEAEFPIAYARIVYSDYLFLEMELAAEYVPQNFYCYTLDSKAPELFKQKVRNLASCFPNVFIADKEFDVRQNGQNMNLAHYECLKRLVKHQWYYVFILQNHDVLIKTNYELVQILTWLNGTNDIMTSGPFFDRIDMKQNWTFAGLGLYKNESKNLMGAHGFDPKLNFANGFVESTVSRAFVDTMMNEMNIEKVLNMLNIQKYGVDEILMATLQATDALDMPGGFTHYCLEYDRGYDHIANHITRMSIWWEGDRTICPTKFNRHNICIFGAEDLHRIMEFPHFFANKILGEYDFAALVCWYEKLFNLAYNTPQEPTRLNKTHYMNLLPVLYHQERVQNGFVNLTNFNCKSSVASWKKFRYRED